MASLTEVKEKLLGEFSLEKHAQTPDASPNKAVVENPANEEINKMMVTKNRRAGE